MFTVHNAHGLTRYNGLLVIECKSKIGAYKSTQIDSALETFSAGLPHRANSHREHRRARFELDEMAPMMKFSELLTHLSSVDDVDMVAWVDSGAGKLGYLSFQFPHWISPEKQRGFRVRYINALTRNLRWSAKNELFTLDSVWTDQR